MSYNLFLDDNFTPMQISNMRNISVANKIKYRTNNWIIVKSYNEFVFTIQYLGLPNMVSFDHDLHPEHYDYIFNDENFSKDDDEIKIDYTNFKEKTGYHAAKWLIKYCEKNKSELPICMVHSQNNVGFKNLVSILY